MNKTLMAAPKAVADGAQTVVKLASGDRKTRKRFSKNKGQIVRTAAVGGAGVATAVALGARRRRKALMGKAVGAVTGRDADLNDPALAHKVESEIFRDDDAPKGSVNVNSENAVIYPHVKVDSQAPTASLGNAARTV